MPATNERPLRVLVVAEYYPRAEDPVLGVWAHRQAVAARHAGAQVRVVVLHRPVPPLAALRRRDPQAGLAPVRQPARATLDGIEVTYARYLSPPRPLAYGGWGAWAAPTLRRAVREIRRDFPFDLVHAHYAVPAGDAVARGLRDATPVVVSVHGGDVLSVVQRGARARKTVERTLARARLVLANSADTARRCRAHGARETRVVHLGTDLPPPSPLPSTPRDPDRLVTVGHLVARKRHIDVLHALARLAPTHPRLRWTVVGDGPERDPLRALAAELGVAERIDWRGQLPPAQALTEARAAALFVLPSVDEAFGVAYVEAMAGGVPALGGRGEAGPEEIAGVGEGMVLVALRDPAGLAARIAQLLADRDGTARLGEAARATVERGFTWAACGRATVTAYETALAP